jgi:hypothetical protein
MGGISLPLSVPAIPGTNAVRVIKGKLATGKTKASVFRPPQWTKLALTMITVPPQYNVATPSNGDNTITNSTATGVAGQPLGTATTPDGGTTTVLQGTGIAAQTAKPKHLVFDGVPRLGHGQRARPTKNPIQTGANLTDHIILDPATLSIDIIMTDVLPPYEQGQWVGNPSKSIACFEILDQLRAARIPLTVTTRLKTYENMALVGISPDETVKTLHGLRARLEFEQIFVADVAVEGFSTRPQTTDSTDIGTTQPVPPSAGVVSQNGLPSAATGVESSEALQAQTGTVQGAGNWSSNNTAKLDGSN